MASRYHHRWCDVEKLPAYIHKYVTKTSCMQLVGPHIIFKQENNVTNLKHIRWNIWPHSDKLSHRWGIKSTNWSYMLWLTVTIPLFIQIKCEITSHSGIHFVVIKVRITIELIQFAALWLNVLFWSLMISFRH